MTIVTDKGVEVRYITVDHLPSKVYVTAYHEYAEGLRLRPESKAYQNKVQAETDATILTEKVRKHDWDPTTHWRVMELDFV